MRVTPRRLITLVVLLVAGFSQPGTAPFDSPVLAQDRPEPAPAQPGDQQPTFRAGINYVAVDVIVTDKKDAPVVDLKREDFEVFEDGKPQPIEQFRLVRISAAAAVGNSCDLMGARKSREMPINPMTLPSASRSGSLVVRHQHG